MAEAHVISALRTKRAELDGELHAAERRIAQLQDDIATIDAAIRIFDPTAAPQAINPKAPRLATTIRNGEFSRAVMGTLREASAPMTARDIATKIAADRGVDMSTSAAMQAYIGRVRSALDRKREWRRARTARGDDLLAGGVGGTDSRPARSALSAERAASSRTSPRTQAQSLPAS